ncbi:MAG: hypothetical protein AB7E47_13440 [Desulfovibrionaceae bacterium]
MQDIAEDVVGMTNRAPYKNLQFLEFDIDHEARNLYFGQAFGEIETAARKLVEDLR